jgi:hypothetical protein
MIQFLGGAGEQIAGFDPLGTDMPLHESYPQAGLPPFDPSGTTIGRRGTIGRHIGNGRLEISRTVTRHKGNAINW